MNTMTTNQPPSLAIILATIAAIPPFLTAITTILTNIKSQETVNAEPQMKVRTIKRVAIKTWKWMILKWYFLLVSMASIFLLIFLHFIIVPDIVKNFISISTLNFRLNQINYTSFFVTFILLFNFILYLRAFARMGNNSNAARYFLFSKAIITTDNSKEQVFDQCKKVLMELGANSIELDFKNGKIEATTRRKALSLTSIFGLAGTFSIEIQQVECDLNRAKVQLDFFPFFKLTSLFYSSAIINRFIKNLMNK